MYSYKTYRRMSDAVIDMDSRKMTHLVVSAWFNGIDGLIYVTYKAIGDDS